MASTTAPAPSVRLVSLASIRGNAPDAKDEQLILTLAIESLRCLEAVSVRVEGYDESKEVEGREMLKILDELLITLKRCEDDYLFKEVQFVYREFNTEKNPTSFWEAVEQWAATLLKVVLSIPGYLDPKDLDGGPDIQDKDNVLGYQSDKKYEGSYREKMKAKLQFEGVLIGWDKWNFHHSFKYAANRVLANEDNKARGDRDVVLRPLR